MTGLMVPVMGLRELWKVLQSAVVQTVA